MPGLQPSAEDDRDGFEAMLDEVWPSLIAYARMCADNSADADDVAAETLERALRAWQRGRGPRGEPLPWVLLIAKRLMIDHRRRRRPVKWLSLAALQEPMSRDRGLNQVDAMAWFGSLRGLLTQRQYESLICRYVLDLSDREAGRLLGLSESGVRTTVSRALATLRQHPEVGAR